ncbi:dirigent protein 22-like [Salvia miltiorrhiza]|uniref:dirigent protein 22-like n=1 Tax=Salvia miltiorrhiza TaxID=226208 RepID=UPI0025AD69A4|nr:dirigent protein 22-like [Salvia miltiorrhiza]
MATPISIVLILTISCLLVSTLDVYARKQASSDVAEEATSFLHDICGGREKVMKLQLYVQDLRIGHPNATVVEVAKAAGVTDNSPYQFGSVHVLDDLVTEGPSINSRKLGRIQGLTTNADLSTFGIAMNLNFFFTEGWYAGSTLSILGRNQVMDSQRELPVVGGTGVFRYARGYAIQTSYSFDPATNYAVLEYNIYTTYNARFNEDVEIARM